MKIINIKINEFGNLSNRNFDFSSGFNLIYGNNESGKSTLLQFIKFIFYGVPKKNSETITERNRSFSWQNNISEGSLTLITDENKTYTIERRAILRIGKTETVSEEFSVIDEETGAMVFENEVPGEHFLGVPAAIFESTCFVKQTSMGEIRSNDIGSALENMLLSADENLNLKKSLDKLDSARKLLLHKNGKGGELASIESENENLKIRLAKAMQTRNKMMIKTEEVNELRNSCIEKRHELDKLEDICTAVEKVDAIRKFEDLHRREDSIQNLKNGLMEYKDKITEERGFFPTQEFLSEANEGLSSYNESAKDLANAKENLNTAENNLANAKENYSSQTALDSSQITAKGGSDTICAKLKEKIAISEKQGKNAKSLLTSAYVLIPVWIAAIVVSFFVKSLSFLLYAGIGIFAADIVLLAFGLKINAGKNKLIKEINSELTLCGILPSFPSSLYEKVELARKNLEYCIETEEKIETLSTVFKQYERESDIRRADFDKAVAKVESIVEKWKTPKETIERISGKFQKGEDPVIISLNCVTEDMKSIMDMEQNLNLKISSMENSAKELALNLSQYDEKDLRARVTSDIINIYNEQGYENIDKKRRFCATALRSLTDKCAMAEKELVRMESEGENPVRIASLIEENEKKFKALSLKYNAIVTAMEALSNAGSNIRNSVTPLLKGKAEKYMNALSEGKYDFIGINKDYAMLTKCENTTRSIDLLSAGTKDIAYLSLRLSLTDMIFRGEKPFIAIDEAFAQLDNQRAVNALKVLSSFCEMGGQCILFTCHDREEALIKNICQAEIIRM